MRAIERQSAGGHHTMGMWVMFEFLISGVKHANQRHPERFVRSAPKPPVLPSLD
jgi:hypothetical protein